MVTTTTTKMPITGVSKDSNLKTSPIEGHVFPASTTEKTGPSKGGFETRRNEKEEEKEEEEEERKTEVQVASLSNTVAFGEMARSTQNEIEKVEMTCTALTNLERFAMEMVMLMSLMLNVYLVLVYPIMIFMGRKWLENLFRKREEFEKNLREDRRIIPGMKLDMEGRESEREKDRQTKKKKSNSWRKLFGCAKKEGKKNDCE